MANLAYRRNSVARLVGSYLAPGASFTVTAYAPGARVNDNQTGTTITVDSGHGFPSGSTLDCIVVRGGAMVTGSFTTCAYASATTVTLGRSQTLLDGDRIVNLGNDTGTTSPNYDGSTITIYYDDYAADTISQSRVTCNSSGEYEYGSKRTDIWELVRDGSGAVVDLVPGNFGIQAPATSTDNAIVRWDGTGGVAVQDYSSNAPTISDAGVSTFRADLSVDRDQDAGTTLTVENESSGTAAFAVVSVKASVGSVTLQQFGGNFSFNAGYSRLMSNSTSNGLMLSTNKAGAPILFRPEEITRGTWNATGLGIGKSPTVELDVQGSTLVSGTFTAGSSITSGGHLRGAAVSVNITGNDNVTTAGRHLINLTNVSGTNTITLSAPSSVDGQHLYLRCAALTAGTFTLADSGNCSLSAAWAPNADDTLTLIASGTVWYELARSAN